MNKTLRGCILALFTVMISVGLYILVMIYGWGMVPKNWYWIIGGGVLGQLFVRLLSGVVSDDLNRQE